jgi:DNA transformation protein and related proteins
MSEYLDYIKDLLSPFEPLIIKRMFGGYGVYKNKLMIALIASNEIYFKADKKASEYFLSYESEPFTYDKKGKTISLSYWKLPPEVAEDKELLEKWLDLSYEAAKNSKKSK